MRERLGRAYDRHEGRLLLVLAVTVGLVVASGLLDALRSP